MFFFVFCLAGIILLMSDDGDYASSLEFLTKRGFVILLAVENSGQLLRDYSRCTWFFSELISGDGPRLYSPAP